MSEKYGNRQFWNNYWGEEQRSGYEFLFSEIVNRYINWSDINNYMEVGGAPGTIMSYMFHMHKLAVSTVDYCDSNIISELLERNRVENYKIYNDDFSEFDTANHYKEYDLVASWGFIEHFEIEKSDMFIQKHKEMVSDNGYLIIELPNIRGFNWLIYRLINKELLKIHNINTMDINFLKHSIERDNTFKVLYGDYYLSSFFEYSSMNEFFCRHRVVKKFFSIIKKVSAFLGTNNIPNRFFSPYIVFIAQRIEG